MVVHLQKRHVNPHFTLTHSTRYKCTTSYSNGVDIILPSGYVGTISLNLSDRILKQEIS